MTYSVHSVAVGHTRNSKQAYERYLLGIHKNEMLIQYGERFSLQTLQFPSVLRQKI